ncbi:hypothetical protein D3C76_639460 [compost metagenome]
MSVTLCLIQTIDLVNHFFGNCQTSSIVSSAVDAVARRQLFHSFAHVVIVEAQVTVSVNCANVSVNKHSHRNHPP